MKHYKAILSSKFLPKTVKDFTKDSKAVAAVEFALIAPLLLLLFVGTVEVSLAVAVDRKLSRTSSAVADLVTQLQSPTGADVESILGVTDRIMFPYTNRIPCVVISELRTTFDANMNGTIEASETTLVTFVTQSYDNRSPSPSYTAPVAAQCAKSSVGLPPNENARQARAVNSEFELPNTIRTDGARIWVAEVEYDHSPIVGFFSRNSTGGIEQDSGAITLGDRIFLRPRQS